jgi:nucleoside-diphosphate-sugar epimerase
VRAVVVGAAGFIGSHLSQQLEESGTEVLGVDSKPLPESSPVRNAMRAQWPSPEVCDAILDGRFDQVFLLGGTASVAGSLEAPTEDLEANAGDLVRFLEAMRRGGSQSALVFVSSAAVYGEPSQIPVTTESATAPISPYGVSKLAGDLYARVYGKLHSLKTVVVRPFSVYGPGLRRQVVWDILSKLHQKNPPLLHGTGDETRDFVFVEDLCRALIAAGAEGKGLYNVCSGQETTIAELARRLAELSGVEPLRFSGVGRPGDPERWLGDYSGLARLGWSPQVTLDEGLRRTVAWFQETAG